MIGPCLLLLLLLLFLASAPVKLLIIEDKSLENKSPVVFFDIIFFRNTHKRASKKLSQLVISQRKIRLNYDLNTVKC